MSAAKLEYTFKHIPTYFRERPQWVVWKYEDRDGGKKTKVPYQSNDGPASSTDPTTWAALSYAEFAFRTASYDGIGYMVAEGEDIVMFDFDHVLNAAILNPIAAEIVKSLDSYTEITPSGTGLHTYALGAKPGERCKTTIAKGTEHEFVFEMYEHSRFFTFTGWHYEATPTTVETRQDAITAVYERVFPAAAKPKARVLKGRLRVAAVLTDEDVLMRCLKAKNSGKFSKLYGGDITEYDDQSRADFALVGMFRFYTQDAEQIERLMRRSKLARDKWDTSRNGGTYLSYTIENALKDEHEVYTQPSSGNGTATAAMPAATDDDPGGERFTDRANARRLAEVATGLAAHVAEMKDKWYVWEGGRLKLDFELAMHPRVDEVSRALFLEMRAEAERADGLKAQQATMAASDPAYALLAARIEASLQRVKRLRDGAIRLESQGGASACIAMAKAEPSLRLAVEKLDAHPLWLNTKTGTLNIETMEMWEPRFADYLTKVTGASYNPLATCPRWEQFLAEVLPDPEVRAFMQRSVGYALTDLMTEQCLWFLYGKGQNGKTTFLNAIRWMLGEYGSSTKASTLMVKKHGDERRNDVAVLRGARFVSATEAEDGQRMAESLIKEITGQDPITARLLYAEYFQFQPTFKIFLAANHKPIITGVDLAIWRRIHLVPFTTTIPDSQKDGGLPETLRAESAGILNWALVGFAAWAADGLRPPKAVTDATAEYRHESDPLAEFLEDKCILSPGVECASAELYAAYDRWAQTSGINWKLTAKMFGLQLQDRGFTAVRIGHAQTRGWRGLKVKF